MHHDMHHDDFEPPKIPQAHRLVGTVAGFTFAAIGIVLIGWLWFQGFGFGHPPLIFRLVGTGIAVMFVVIGGTGGLTALKGEMPNPLKHRLNRFGGGRWDRSNRRTGYTCPTCGAALSDSVDVSPSGDVKCEYCRTWFNIHA